MVRDTERRLSSSEVFEDGMPFHFFSGNSRRNLASCYCYYYYIIIMYCKQISIVHSIRSCVFLLPAAIGKSGIVFNVCLCLSMLINEKVSCEVMSCSVNHHVTGCECFDRCLYVCLFRWVSKVFLVWQRCNRGRCRHKTWQVCIWDQSAGRVRRLVSYVAARCELLMASSSFLNISTTTLYVLSYYYQLSLTLRAHHIWAEFPTISREICGYCWSGFLQTRCIRDA